MTQQQWKHHHGSAVSILGWYAGLLCWAAPPALQPPPAHTARPAVPAQSRPSSAPAVPARTRSGLPRAAGGSAAFTPPKRAGGTRAVGCPVSPTPSASIKASRPSHAQRAAPPARHEGPLPAHGTAAARRLPRRKGRPAGTQPPRPAHGPAGGAIRLPAHPAGQDGARQARTRRPPRWAQPRSAATSRTDPPRPAPAAPFKGALQPIAAPRPPPAALPLARGDGPAPPDWPRATAAVPPAGVVMPGAAAQARGAAGAGSAAG